MIFMWLYACMHMCGHSCVNMQVYICVGTPVWTCMCVCVQKQLCEHACVHMCRHSCVNMHVCICAGTPVWTCMWRRQVDIESLPVFHLIYWDIIFHWSRYTMAGSLGSQLTLGNLTSQVLGLQVGPQTCLDFTHAQWALIFCPCPHTCMASVLCNEPSPNTKHIAKFVFDTGVYKVTISRVYIWCKKTNLPW